MTERYTIDVVWNDRDAERHGAGWVGRVLAGGRVVRYFPLNGTPSEARERAGAWVLAHYDQGVPPPQSDNPPGSPLPPAGPAA